MLLLDSVMPPMLLEVVDALLKAPFDETIEVPEMLMPTPALIVPLLNVMIPAGPPTMRRPPETSNALPGAVVPIPTNEFEIRIRSVPLVVNAMRPGPGKKTPVVRSSEKV
jgi:hypothetical protein